MTHVGRGRTATDASRADFKPMVAGAIPAGGTTFPISERTPAARTRRAPGPVDGRFDSNCGSPSTHAGDGRRTAGRWGNLKGSVDQRADGRWRARPPPLPSGEGCTVAPGTGRTQPPSSPAPWRRDRTIAARVRPDRVSRRSCGRMPRPDQPEPGPADWRTGRERPVPRQQRTPD